MRTGSGRKKGKKTSDTVQITARVKPKTAGKLDIQLGCRVEALLRPFPVGVGPGQETQ